MAAHEDPDWRALSPAAAQAAGDAAITHSQAAAGGVARPQDASRQGLDGWQFWLLTGLAAVAFVLVLANISLAFVIEDDRVEISNRQRFINESLQLSRLNTQLIRSLAENSASTGDSALRELLTSQGIRFTVNSSDSGGEPSLESGEDFPNSNATGIR